MQKGDTVFSVETWNHPGLGKYYPMLWGPYPMSMWSTIKDTLLKNLDPQVKSVKYKHKYEDTYN